jgi:hypothetical protein
MAKMGLYCKAYPSERLRAFSEWSISAREPDPVQDHYYVQEDFTVTTGIFLDDHRVWETVTPEWREFCAETLSFAVPEDRRPDPVPERASEQAADGR